MYRTKSQSRSFRESKTKPHNTTTKRHILVGPQCDCVTHNGSDFFQSTSLPLMCPQKQEVDVKCVPSY